MEKGKCHIKFPPTLYPPLFLRVKLSECVRFMSIARVHATHFTLLIESDPEKFKNHQLPLARVKKIMKSDEDVRVSVQLHSTVAQHRSQLLPEL